VSAIKEKRKTAYIFVFVLVVSTGFLLWYLHISNDEMPMMGFWPGFDEFATKLFTNQLTISDFFSFPHPLHWSKKEISFVRDNFSEEQALNVLGMDLWGCRNN